MTRIVLFAALVAMIATPSFAQFGARGRARGRALNAAEVERTIKRLENNTDAFQKAVDRQLDRSVLDGTKREDRINDRVKDLEKATDRLRDRFDRSDDPGETRADVQEVVRAARVVDGLFGRVRGYAPVRSNWAYIRSDINTLARLYRVPGLR